MWFVCVCGSPISKILRKKPHHATSSTLCRAVGPPSIDPGTDSHPATPTSPPRGTYLRSTPRYTHSRLRRHVSRGPMPHPRANTRSNIHRPATPADLCPSGALYTTPPRRPPHSPTHISPSHEAGCSASSRHTPRLLRATASLLGRFADYTPTPPASEEAKQGVSSSEDDVCHGGGLMGTNTGRQWGGL